MDTMWLHTCTSSIRDKHVERIRHVADAVHWGSVGVMENQLYFCGQVVYTDQGSCIMISNSGITVDWMVNLSLVSRLNVVMHLSMHAL